MPRAVVLVEGVSDRAAVQVLAARLGIDLSHVEVRSMGGITNIRRHLSELASVRAAGLYDLPEAVHVARALGRRVNDDLEQDGFFACRPDLEHELLRALGLDAALGVVEAEDDLGRFRALQHQPAHRGADPLDQLHRFLGSKGGRKEQYADLLAHAVPLSDVPQPLLRLLRHVDGR